MTQEYWVIKEQFGILRNIDKYMDWLHEIRTLYPNTVNMTLKEVDDWLANRYAEMDAELEKKLEQYNCEQTPLMKEIMEESDSLFLKVLKNIEIKRQKSKGRLV